jgi:hypothetical protein
MRRSISALLPAGLYQGFRALRKLKTVTFVTRLKQA